MFGVKKHSLVEGVAAVCTKDNDTAMPFIVIGICSVGALWSGAATEHIDARIPIFQMVGRHCQALHPMALDLFVLFSELAQCVY
jgi:hypothetical protein